ncbi:MAG: hypothetical protein AB7J40_00835 [Candidatus Altimarinota bacterium]
MNTLEQLHELISEPLIAEKLPHDLLERIKNVEATNTQEIEAIMRQLLIELESIIPLLSAEEDSAFADLASKVDTLEAATARQQAALESLHAQEANVRGGLQKVDDGLKMAEEL